MDGASGVSIPELGVMDAAHQQGLASTATMMFGHVESVEDRIEHLERVRQQQDRSLERLKTGAVRVEASQGKPLGGAFTAFISWTFQPQNTALKAPGASSHEYLRTQAIARLYLDNIPNIQSSWVTQGAKIGQVALFFGANDMGSLMIEENVVASAGTVHYLTLEQIKQSIREAGYIPRQRNVFYEYIDEGPASPVSLRTTGTPSRSLPVIA